MDHHYLVCYIFVDFSGKTGNGHQTIKRLSPINSTEFSEFVSLIKSNVASVPEKIVITNIIKFPI